MQSSNKPYILFVDDEDMTRKMFERIAGKEFDVLTAESVPAAKTLLDLHSEKIGVLLTDQRMPGQLGVELLEYCRDAYPGIVRMLTTAYSDLADAIAAVNRGEIIRYIEKPWTNIDALLIDLRVAMRFHLLERENQKLLDEKLSVGASISRLDRVRSLIEIAAAQIRYPNRLAAVEHMLRDIAVLDCVQNPLKAQVLAELEMFGQPVSDTLAAIAVANGLADFSAYDESASWRSLEETCKAAGATCAFDSERLKDLPLSAELIHMILGGLAAIAGETGDRKIAIDKQGAIWLLTFAHQGQGSALIGDWMTGLHLDEASMATAGLLQLYLSAFAGGFSPEVQIEKNALIKIAIELSSSAEGRPSASLAGAADWVDDILLLYS